MSRYVVNLTWDDAPHLNQSEKDELWLSIPPYMRSARTKGIPYLGSGLIYPFAEERIRVDPFRVPREWPRCFGLDSDAGAGFTAIVWLAWDRENSMVYLTHCYKSDSRSKADHLEALRAKGTTKNPFWIPGVGDAKGLVVTEHDSAQVIDLYKKAGVDINYPDKSVEAGIQDLYDQINIGKFKVFTNCNEWFTEFRQYHRKDGKIVKVGDHLMDACVVGETEILTGNGPRAIASLVGTKGWVLTRSGAWSRYCGARRTIEQTETIRLVFQDGSAVCCTPDHPFLTPTGWVRADQMTGRGCYNGVTQRIQWHAASRQHFKSLKAFVTTSAASIGSAMESVFIGKCGNPPMIQSRPGTMFITSTATGPTMPWGIWSLSPHTSINPTIIVGTSDPSLKRRAMPLDSGINPQAVVHGTRSITIQPRSTWWPISSVNNAVNHFGRRPLEPTASVPMPVSPPLVARLVWTIRNVLAWCVVSSLWRIVTRRNAPARAAALTHCLSVEPAGKADVYCLTVPGASAFCLANGAVVHNTRYAVRSGLARAKVAPLEKEPEPKVLVYEMGQQGTGWLGM